MGCGGGGNNSTTTVQQADPWVGQQPYLTDMLQQAQYVYRNNQPRFYQGNMTAPFTGLEQQGQQQAVGAAQGPIQGLADQAAGANNFMLGDVLRADSNPYMAQYARGAIDPMYEALTRQALPAIQGGAIASGQMGGSRQGIAQGLAINEANEAALNTTSKMYSDMYGQGLDAMSKGLALAPQTASMALAPSQVLSGVGAQQRAMDQAAIDQDIAHFTHKQTRPWDTLAAYQGMIQGNYGGTGTSSVSGQDPGTAQQLVGAAGTGLATYGALAGAGLTAAAPWAAGGMALLSLF